MDIDNLKVKEGRIWNYHLSKSESDTSLCGENVVYTELDIQAWEEGYHEEYQLNYCDECDEIAKSMND